MEDIQQHWFPWAAVSDGRDVPEVVLDRETTAAVITLLARALIAVVHTIEETPDER